MTKDEIMRMAREAGFEILADGEVGIGDGWHIQTDLVERFAALVAAAERAECIDLVAMYSGPVDLEAAIRARGEK